MRLSSRCVRLFSLAAIAVALPAALFAVVTEIRTTPPAPLVVGTTVEYKVISNAAVVGEYSFQYRCAAHSPPTPWVPDPALTGQSNSWSFIENRVGNQEVKGGALEQFSTQPIPLFQWNYLTKPITIVGPDKDEIIQGLNVDSGGWPIMVVEVHFKVLAGTIPVGPAIDGFPQERIRRPQNPPPDNDTGWGGPEVGVFHWTGSYILDKKTITPSNPVAFSQLPNGYVLDDYYRECPVCS